MTVQHLTAVVKKEQPKRSKRFYLAEKVRRERGTHLGRSMDGLSIAECIRIGRIYGIVAQQKNTRGGKRGRR